ncbi:MAG: TIGR04283 family arsenosugar biosynthesis glycosyltransferase [Gammaproteobacteria bacterium]|nr:TIGR04283 family arsenosugar biosynthesis glycosyltransferase [Gammaproteobacteria bacterium]MDH5594029.1 TIGR04283 family arsenosugar biosynthesis glycosyltransferase [Gammaproteobacteria bacterium]
MVISIIIPALNEEKNILQTLSSLQTFRQRGHEIILVDGGSTDSTESIAKPLCDIVLSTRKGRACQMHAGATASHGDVLWFIHADTIAPQNADHMIEKALTKKSWGRFDVTISGKSWLFRIIAVMMNLRSRITGICTGDQGIFVKKETYMRHGGYPDIPLMEDIAISKQLKKTELPACITIPMLTSGRRWDQKGVVKTMLLMWWLRFLYFIGVSPVKLSDIYK